VTYADILTSIMRKRPEVVVLTAEARKALGTIPEEFSDRFYDFGIAEQNMVGAAAGMSAAGKVPIIHSPLATFITMRSFEQIRTTVAMNGHNVKIPGLLPGFSTGFQGPTHVSLEDLALMRAIPGVTVMVAASQDELKEVMERAFDIEGCVYFRVPNTMPEQIAYAEAPPPIVQPRVARRGKDGLVVATGGMVARALEAIEQLATEGTDLSLVNLSQLKPAPADALAELIRGHEKVATVEEHFITGGLGSVIAEVIAEAGLGATLCRIGVNDVFPDRYARHEENLRYVGLDCGGVAARLKEFF
jgi:transketolase